MTYLCMNCWKEIEQGEDVCPHCHAEQEKLMEETFVEKLIRALRHTESQTPIRAAFVLGQMRAKIAVPELVRILQSSPDPFIPAACARALGSIGGAEALRGLLEVLNLERSVIVRAAVQEAMDGSGRGNKSDD